MGFKVFKPRNPDLVCPRKDYSCLFQHRYSYTYMCKPLNHNNVEMEQTTDFFRDVDEVLDTIKAMVMCDERTYHMEYEESRFKDTCADYNVHWQYLYSKDELIEQFKDSGEAGSDEDESAFEEEFEVWTFNNADIFKYKGTITLTDKSVIDASWSRSNTKPLALIAYLEEQLENVHICMYNHWLRLDHPRAHKLYPTILNEKDKQKTLNETTLAIDEIFELILRICSEYGFDIPYEINETIPDQNYILERNSWLSQFKTYAPNKVLRCAMSIIYSILVILFEGIDD